MVDPDNEERLLKVPYRVVQEIKSEEKERIVKFIRGLTTTPNTYHFAETIIWYVEKSE